MSLFQRDRDKSRLKFDCLELSNTELNELRKLVEENGGEVGENTELPIKFMKREMYNSDMYPSYRLYDIDFIRTCIKKGRLVNPKRFKLGPKKSGEHCIMSHFLYGYCQYENILSTIQYQGSPIILDSPSTSGDEGSDDDMSLMTRVNRSLLKWRSRSAVRRSQDVALDEIEQSQDQESVENAHLPVDESQSVVSNTYTRRLQTQANGDDTSTRLESTDHNKENWQCNSDNEEDIKPNISELPQRANENYYQSHSPDALPTPGFNGLRTLTVEMAMEFVEVKEELPDSQYWPSVPKSPKSLIEDTTEASRALSSGPSPSMPKSPNSDAKADPLETEVIDRSSNGQKSSVSQTMSSNQSSQVPRSPYGRNAAVSPRMSLKISDAPARTSRTYPCNEKYPRLRVIAEASTRFSQGTPNEPEESSPWIMPDDAWMQEPNLTNRVHPVTEYVECDDGKVPLLRTNPVSSNNPKMFSSTKLVNPKYRSDTRTSPGKSKDTSLIEEASAGVKLMNGMENSARFRQKSSVNSEKWNKPGPSGLNSRDQTVHCDYIILDSSSGDEDARQSIAAEESVGGRRRIDLPLDSSGSDNEANSKTKKNREVRKKNGQYRDSFPSDDDEEDAPTKRKNHCYVKGRLRNVKKKYFSPGSESEEEAPQFVRRKRVRNNLGLDNDLQHAKRNGRGNPSNDSSDEDYDRREEMRLRERNNEKRKKALQYGRSWRSQLDTDRPIKIKKTHMAFTKEEQKIMVDYLTSYDNIVGAYPKGLKIWHEMLRRGKLPHRTPQSLQNHFSKHLLPHIDDYFHDMSDEHKEQFKALQCASRKAPI